MRRVYLDHSATTPMRKEVAEIMSEYFTVSFGNPSGVYSFGREAKEAIEKARAQIACALHADSQEIIFTSGGTEADNLALWGIAQKYGDRGKHIITSAIEHHAVLHVCEHLVKMGFRVTVLPVDADGLVRMKDLQKAITAETILISIMHVNNEVGTIQPLEEIGMLAKEQGILFHTDAVQSLGKIHIDVEKLKIDLLSGSGHKIYGPKGSGFLYIRKGVKISPLIMGGSQERGLRAGTENVPGIVGLGKAVELAEAEMDTEIPRLTELRDWFIKKVREQIPDVELNGHPHLRVATNINLCFRSLEGESLLISLDLKGIAASSGSACSSGSVSPSHVLLAMGMEHEAALGSVRITLGRDNTKEDLHYVLEELPPLVHRLRRLK